ncbi:MAG: hypothetical protein CMF58_06445 [Lentimicrobiaceae bacterium]|jgi:ion channel-forming bestrophin family protein|nr:hypothetical protein [Lentimicrobiaceae bacterium]MDG1902080.1 bestrophin family ion channel [Bacteroidales bacterium]
MYVKRRYGFWMTFNWSKEPFIYGVLYGLVITSFSYFTQIYISLPWAPLGLIGIAVAFYLGFKNNSSYDRIWEARKIWGSIVNNSRTFSVAVITFVQGENKSQIQKELIYRHIAWITILRHQLRLSKEWEHFEQRVKGVYAPHVSEGYNRNLDKALSNYLSTEEISELDGKTNKAAQLLKIQSLRLQELRDKEYYEDFRHMEFHKLIANFYDGQGKSERIKNFPFPRQYVTGSVWLTILFCVFVPFGLLDVMGNRVSIEFWAIPFLTGLICWVFGLMEKIGDYSENPFEGTYNDVPITAISRGIEIDLREMIDDSDIPEQIKDTHGFLM